MILQNLMELLKLYLEVKIITNILHKKLFDKEKKSQLIYPKGSLIIFNGLSWHTATSNFSYDSRTAILGQYLPYFITPMIDLKKNLNKKQLKNIDAGLRQLLGIDLKNPEIRQ